jgi:hypothetical protein
MPDTYRVFKRAAWKRNPSYPGGWEPYVGRALTVKTGLTLEEARRLCREGPANKALREGREYRGLTFYEFDHD